MTSAKSLIRELRALGVLLSIDARGRLAFDAPEGVIGEEMIALIRNHRDELLATIESLEERAAILEHDAGMDRSDAESAAWEDVVNEAPEPMPPGVICPWCNGSRLVDALEGLRCWNCGQLAWVSVAGSTVRADCLKSDLRI